MSTVPTTAAGTAGPVASNPAPQTQDQTTLSENNKSSQINWDSEIQLVSSLAKLQELERKIHELRQILPGGLLNPLLPISNPKLASVNGAADSPAQLRESLDRAARNGLAEIKDFQSQWRGPELHPLWTHVEARIRASNGQLIQPTGLWEMDYDVLLRELVNEQKGKEEERQREEEDAERAKAQSSEGEWENIAEKYLQREIPGVRAIKGQRPLSLAVALAKAGMVLLVQGVKEPDVVGVSEWQLSIKMPPGRQPTKLESSILECLKSRSRKWDLAFLLDMISSYGDIKQTACVKCNNLTDSGAQLPTIRRPVYNPSSEGEQRTFTFDALHTDCA